MEENKTIEQEAPVVETPAVEETVAEAPAVEAAPAAETKKVCSNASVDPADFDWDAFENEGEYGDRAQVAEAYEKTLTKVC